MDEEFGPAAIAIALGDLDELARLLSADPALASRPSTVSHPTLLQFVACEEANIVDPVGAARLLMRAGAPTAPPLVAAAGCGSRTVLEFMLDEGVDIDGDGTWTALDEALYWSKDDIAALLVARGAGVRALSTAAGLGDLALIGGFFDGSRPTPDAGPIGSPFIDTVPESLADDPDAIVDHALVMAVCNGRREAAAFLLERGARINATPPGYHWRGTALHAAVWRGDRSLVEWLLAAGADPSIRDGFVDDDALGWARHNGHEDLVELLGAG